MATKTWAIFLVLFSTLLISSGQLLIKFGVEKISISITNYALISGLFLYVISAVLLLIALRHGELSVLYPIIATSYIWVSLLSPVFFQEAVNTLKWMGIVLIVCGVSFIGISNKQGVFEHD